MFTTETAVESVKVKLSTVMLLAPPSVDSFAYPVTPLVASAAPHPSQRQPGAVASCCVGR